MMLFDDGEIYIYAEPVDWRYRLLRQMAIAEIGCGINIRDRKAYVVFYNRQRTALRVLYYRNDAICLLESRLDAGYGKYPIFFSDSADNKVSALTKEELQVIFNRGVGSVSFCRSA